MSIDLALAEQNGLLVLHQADCPQARELAEAGRPVLTMLDCARMPSDDWPRHECLDER